jgi:hypothetical protein
MEISYWPDNEGFEVALNADVSMLFYNGTITIESACIEYGGITHTMPIYDLCALIALQEEVMKEWGKE